MPTPRPIIEAIIVEVTGRVDEVGHDADAAEADASSPMRAVTIGIAIAISEPNATSSTITATARPMSSLLWISSCDERAGELGLDAALAGDLGGLGRPPRCARSSSGSTE